MLSACVAAGIGVWLLGTDWCINPIVLRVEWWFDGKHFSSLNRIKLNCTSYSSCFQRVRRATQLVRDVVWHSWAGDHDKLFCVQSVSECQLHTRSHDSVDAFVDCLPGLRHSQFLVDTQRTRSATARLHLPALRIFFNRVSIGLLPYFEHLLWACLTDTWTERTYV